MLTGRFPWFAPILLGCLALLVRLQFLDQPPRVDELYHFLAAQSWLAEGQLRIAEGIYTRTALFTIFLAHWIGLFGETLVVARLPSVIAGTALVVLVFLWSRSVAGTLAGVLAALLLALDPESIGISQFVRFYAVHGLLFWLGAIAAYQLVLSPPPAPGRLLLLAVGCLICFGAALYLQVTTLIGLLGVAAWAAVALGVPWLARLSPRARWSVVAGAALLGAAVIWVVVEIGLAAQLLARYQHTSLYQAEIGDAFWYYHFRLIVDYPTLWPLVALALLVGLAYRPRPTAFCASVVAIAFVVHSFAGAKAMRYFSYIQPFLFVLWGIALAEIWPRLRWFLEDAAGRALVWLGLGRFGRPGALAALAVVLGFAVVANGAFVRTTASMLDIVIPPITRPADWAAAKEPLAPRLADAAVVVTTSDLEALYHLGHYDVLISSGRLAEFSDREFSIDFRTGRPVITKPESLALLMDCYPDGLIVSSASRWRNPSQLDDAVADLIIERTEELDLPAYGMQAYVWRQPDETRRAEACAALHDGAGGDLAAAHKP